MTRNLVFPLNDLEILQSLKAGELCTLSGIIYTARDQAHKRLFEALDRGAPLPFDLNGSCIYYCGPTPPRADNLFGAAGPTTSARMDPFTPRLYDLGLKATLGKGGRSEDVRQACIRNRSVYLVTFGGAAAYLATRIKAQSTAAWPDLGAEAVYRLEIENFPCVVGIDTQGNTI